MSDLEERIFSGEFHEVDAEWAEFLDEVFDDISIADLIEKADMDASKAKRLLAVTAMKKRFSEC